MAGWATTRFLVGRDRLWLPGQPRPTVISIDDLVIYIAVGIIVGGRAGYVLFYNLPFFLDHPAEIPKLWTGGMAFHGGLVGAVLGFWIFARRHRLPLLTVADVVAAGVPFGLLFGRLANFLKPELWGRPTDVPWAMVFPGGGPLPRHPSQLYEAALEGLVLLLVLAFAIRQGALRRPGIVAGLFALGLWARAHRGRVLPRARRATRVPVRPGYDGNAAVPAACGAGNCFPDLRQKGRGPAQPPRRQIGASHRGGVSSPPCPRGSRRPVAVGGEPLGQQVDEAAHLGREMMPVRIDRVDGELDRLVPGHQPA